jgi:hypothetical protein
MVRTLKKTFSVLALVAVVGLAFFALTSEVATEASRGPSCEIQCKIDYNQCKNFCGKKAQCLISCETQREFCLSNCGAITQ